MERIPALPYPLRSALIQLFCPVHIQTAAYEAPGNADCLIRPYLGRLGRGSERDSKGVAPKRSFSLRNFGLDLGGMEVLGLLKDGDGTAVCWAGVMGRTLAVLHWGVGVDGRDVEFVLGGRPVGRTEHMTRVDGFVRATAPWSTNLPELQSGFNLKRSNRRTFMRIC